MPSENFPGLRALADWDKWKPRQDGHYECWEYTGSDLSHPAVTALDSLEQAETLLRACRQAASNLETSGGLKPVTEERARRAYSALMDALTSLEQETES